MMKWKEWNRFWKKVHITENGCWDWTASKNDHGYGQFALIPAHLGGKPVRVHRLAYEWLVGKIPEHLICDHICNNRACVNPSHIQLTNHRVNILRGNGMSARHVKKTACPNGHPYDRTRKRGDGSGRTSRYCSVCMSKLKAAWYQRWKARHVQPAE